MSSRPLTILKIVSGRSLARKEVESSASNKTRSSSAESNTKISLKNILIKKSKENLLPKEKPVLLPRSIGRPSKLQKFDMNIQEINNTFYRRMLEIEPKLNTFESTRIPENLISPVKLRT